MSKIKKVMENNYHWSEEILKKNPSYFENLAKGQHPEYLWIGCSDSRVPANQITDMRPGSIFVHRNIANLVIHTDMNMLSVVYFAIEVLGIENILICGHYECGGVHAAMNTGPQGFIDNWLNHIRRVQQDNAKELNAIKDDDAREKRLVELNVKQQVENLSNISFIQNRWKNSKHPYIHGIVFDVKSGKLKDLGITTNQIQE